MLHHDLVLVIGLLFAVSLLTMLGPKLRIAPPIFLLLGGSIIAFIPGIPRISLQPEMIFLVFLPPLLYEAAWHTPWPEFWKWRRSIGLLAFGLVFFTSMIVAYFSSSFIPGFTIALGFLLGGIISPPDAVAATSVLKSVNPPRRGTIILEGESLVNDASSLIVFRFALAAVLTGGLSIGAAVEDFFLVCFGGILVGIVLGNVLYFLHRMLPTTPSIDTAITLMTPYIAYIIAEGFEFSGVMAVVTCGLFLSFRAHDFLDYRSRMQSNGTWNTLGFVLNGLVFILLGLELPVVTEGLSRVEIMDGIRYGIWISLLVIAVRFLWMFPSAHLPRWLSPRIRRKEASPGWRLPMVLSWAGMRGVVSLAMALAIPFTLPDGSPFPQRSMILLITFIVILVTLLVQGVTLPFVVHWLKVDEVDPRTPEQEQKLALRHRLAKAALDRLALPDVPRDKITDRLRMGYMRVLDGTSTALQELKGELEPTTAAAVDELKHFTLLTITAQRVELTTVRKQNLYDIELIRKQEARLDHEEARVEH